MKTIWFKHLGPFYVPVHLVGYIITMLCILLIVPVWMAVIQNGQSISDDLCQIFVYTTCTAFWWKHPTKINNTLKWKLLFRTPGAELNSLLNP